MSKTKQEIQEVTEEIVTEDVMDETLSVSIEGEEDFILTAEQVEEFSNGKGDDVDE